MPKATETKIDPSDTTPHDLRTWGLSGQPASWSLSGWEHVIETIRMANRGETDAGAVQDSLDATFPARGYQASDVMLAHPPTAGFSTTVNGMAVRVDLDGDQDLGLPDENVTWDFGDGTTIHDAGGWEHTYDEPGEYLVRFTVMAAGSAFHSVNSDQTVTIGDPGERSEEDDPISGIINPGVRGRDATVFESDTDELPNTTVSPEESQAQADAVEELKGYDGTIGPADGGDDDSDESEPFDPSQHTVDEVNEYLAEHPEDEERVLDLEADGKGRVGILGS